MNDNSYLHWYEFEPTNDIYLVRVHPDYSKKESPTGIIIATTMSKVVDRPTTGVIFSAGPDAKKYKIGTQVFFAPNRGFDLEFIFTSGEEKYMLVGQDFIDGVRVKEVESKKIIQDLGLI